MAEDLSELVRRSRRAQDAIGLNTTHVRKLSCRPSWEGCVPCRPLEDAVEDLSELVRRSRRAQDAALRALLPPELLPYVTR